MLRGLKKTLCAPGPRDPTEAEAELCLSILWAWNENCFSSPVSTAQFFKFAGILTATLSQHHLSGFEIATGIPSPPLALFVVMLSKAHLTSHSRMSGSRSVITSS